MAESDEEDYDALLDQEDNFGDEWRETRIAEMKVQAEMQSLVQNEGHGRLREIREDEFLPEVTASKCVIVHFFHEDFRRCKILDTHLEELAGKHPEAKFTKMNAEKCQFFVTKLNVKVLPALLFFHGGVNTDRMVGFEDIGNDDNFETAVLEERIAAAGCIRLAAQQEKRDTSIFGMHLEKNHDSDDDDE